MKRLLILLLFAVSALAQTTVTITRNDASPIAGASSNHRAGLNLVEILNDSPYNKNVLNGNSGDTGFEYQNAVQVWQTQGGSGCTLSTTQWQSCVNNAQFGPYTANQWVNADFTVIQGPDTGYVGTVTANTVSGPGTGTGAIFTVTPANSVAFQIGDVIKISTNCNMTNVCPTPSSQYTTNPYWGTWSVFNSATLGTDTTPADLCATCGKQSMKITFGATNSFATVAMQFAGGTVQKSLVMNGTYTASVWAKSSTGSATVSGSITARSGSNCTMSNQTVTTSWAQYTWSCSMTETTSGSGNAIATFQVSAGGSTGTILFDNVSFSNNADNNASQFTNALVNTLKAWAQTTQNTTGLKPTLRYAPDTTITTLANIINNEMQQSPSPEGPQTNLTGGTYTKTKVGFNEFLGLCQTAGFIPELIVPLSMTTTDAAFLADFLQGTNASLAGVAARQALGQSGPWVGSVASGAPFQSIYLEFGNENWNGAFIGETLGFRTSETGGVLGDYARWMGTIDTAFRNQQTAQSYDKTQTFWVANAQTASNGSTMSDTATNANPDLFEFDGYTSFGLDSVTSSSCSNFSGTTCDLYMTGVSEAYLNVHDSSSPHGFYQSLNTATGLSTCGPSHTATCRASVYEENVYPQASTSGPVTQSVSDSYTQTGNQGVMFATQILENATASFHSLGIEVQNLYHSHQYFQGEGGVNVHMWGGHLDSGGDCSTTNSSAFGGSYCPRPQALAAQVANWAMLGFPVSCSNNSPTYTIPNMGTTNNNGLTIGQTPPYVRSYCFASANPIVNGTKLSEVIVNADPGNSYNISLAGTNIPSTVTEYQFASPSLTSMNELGGLSNISTNVINGTTSGIINSGPTTGVSVSGLNVPAMSVTAIEWTAVTTSVAVDFNSRSGGTVIGANIFGTNITNLSSATPLNSSAPTGDLFTPAGLNVIRLFVSENQLCPAGSCSGLSSSVLNSQLTLIKKNPNLQVLLSFYQTDSSLGGSGPNFCQPPTSASTWATNIGTIISFVQSSFSTVTIAGITLRNEPDLTGDWCPGTGTNLSNYETFIGTVGPQLKTAFPSLLIGMPSLAAPATNAATWIPGVLGSWASPDFIDYHLYLGSQSSWANYWAAMQNVSSGIGFYYNSVTGLAGSIPVWVTETNNNAAFATDCCRNDASFGPLWNALMATDYLNPSAYSSTTVPAHVLYYSDQSTASPNFFCLVGTPSTTNCDVTTLSPYPQYYAYQLLNSSTMLNLSAGGHLATSNSPGATTSTISTAAWYTSRGDHILIVNPTSSAVTSIPVTISNAGIPNAHATQFLLNSSNSTITPSSLALIPSGGGYSATVTVPANSTLGITVNGSTSISMSGKVRIQGKTTLQ